VLGVANLPTKSTEGSDQRSVGELVASLQQREVSEAGLRVPRATSPSASQQAVGVTYLPAPDKVLVSRGSQLKLVCREGASRGAFFLDPASLHFGNGISQVWDEVSLFLSPEDLAWLLKHLDWAQSADSIVVARLLGRIEQTYDGRAARVPWLEGLLALKRLGQAAVRQAEQLEGQGRAAEALQLALEEREAGSPDAAAGAQLDLLDAMKLLNVLADLEDQLHQIGRCSEQLTSAAAGILSRADRSRAHTAIGRLASLLGLPSDQRQSPLELAEHGVCNTGDTNLASGLRFY
jgi:hypothetical protein